MALHEERQDDDEKSLRTHPELGGGILRHREPPSTRSFANAILDTIKNNLPMEKESLKRVGQVTNSLSNQAAMAVWFVGKLVATTSNTPFRSWRKEDRKREWGVNATESVWSVSVSVDWWGSLLMGNVFLELEWVPCNMLQEQMLRKIGEFRLFAAKKTELMFK